jgi:hypothetical protein
LETGKGVHKQEKDVRKHVAYTLNFSYTEQKRCLKTGKVVHKQEKTPPKFCQMTCTKLKCRGATATKASKAWALPKFWVTVNPISTRGADYAHQSTMGLVWLKFAVAPMKCVKNHPPKKCVK